MQQKTADPELPINLYSLKIIHAQKTIYGEG